MFKKFMCLTSVSLSLAGPAEARFADLTCDDSARIKQMLSQSMGAERQGGGLRDPDTVLEVWVSPGKGDWTIVQNYANGTSCIVAMGEYWLNEASAQAAASSNRSVAGAGCGDNEDICE